MSTINTLSELKIYGFALVIIVGLGGLGLAVTGVTGFCGVETVITLTQIDFIIMMATGGGMLCLAIGIVCFLKHYQKSTNSVIEQVNKNYPILNRDYPPTFVSTIRCFTDHTLKKQVSGVYILSNESKIEETIQELEDLNQSKTEKAKCHMGVGGLYNFDIIAARRSDYGIIFDFNPHNQEFINHCLECLKITDSPKAFVEALIPYMEVNLEKYNHYDGYDSPLHRTRAELKRTSSWLWQEDTTGKFQYIKKLAEDGKIVAITQDF